MSRPRRPRSRGFTLTELMVSLVMGLIVAVAAIGLARSATTTFHEEVRTSGTEMAVRMAAERLRQDLSRASFMSTPNIVLDPRVSQLANAAVTTPPTPALIARYPELQTLRGINIDVAMVASTSAIPPVPIPPSLAAVGIVPDAIEIVGNMTSDDAYSGIIRMGGPASGCANAQTITLNPLADAAVYGLSGMSATVGYDATRFRRNAETVFTPVAGSTFLAQVTDAVGCNNYVQVCSVAEVSGQLEVYISGGPNKRGVLYSTSASTGADQYENPVGLARGCGASEGGRVLIAPLTRVVWRLQESPTSLDTDPNLNEVKKVDLVRQVLDFNRVPAGPAEVVAEYATDLKFGIVVDLPGAVGAARQVVYEMDSDPGNGDIFRTTAATSADSVIPGQRGPQRVRAVRFRIATRAPVADREFDLPTDAGASRARICVDPNVATCRKFARVRTVVSEVALTNQQGAFY